MASGVPEEVVSKNPEAAEPPLAATMVKPTYLLEDKPVISPPHDDEVPEPTAKKSSKGSHDRDVALAKLEDDKRLSFVKAWEESEKSKVENKAQKKACEIASWENTKKASLEAQLKKTEENLEKKRADYAERMKNKVALLHKQAEEKRAMVEAKRGEEIVKVEEMAGKYRATGQCPKKTCGCF